MRCVKTVAYQAIGLMLSMLLLDGCQSNQQTRCRREKQKLQKTIEAQQAQIDELKHRVEATTYLLFQVTGQLEECKGLRPKAEGAKKENVKVTKKPERRQVPRTKAKVKRPPKSKNTKRKGGCPCRRKRSK